MIVTSVECFAVVIRARCSADFASLIASSGFLCDFSSGFVIFSAIDFAICSSSMIYTSHRSFSSGFWSLNSVEFVGSAARQSLVVSPLPYPSSSAPIVARTRGPF